MKRLLTIILLLWSLQDYSQVKTCMDVVINTDLRNKGENGVYDYNSRWTNGATVKVMFAGGSEYVRSKVTYYSKQWENWANIHFDFISYGTPDILVSFVNGKGSWSEIGTNSKYDASHNIPTMNFGWFDSYTQELDFKSTTLHEFGHALGLLHEHKNPLGNIHWNLPAVYNYYQAQGWSIDKINEQVISKYSVELSNHNYDEHSIMHYPIPANLTTDGYSVGWNTELSSGDKELIAEMYPKNRSIVIKTDPVGTQLGKAASCNLNNIRIEHNVVSNLQKGMKIYLSFTINNAEYTNCLAAAYFYYANGTPLKDFNNSYNTTTGNIASSRPFTPIYSSAVFNEFEIFMPYDELEMGEGETDLKLSISIWSSKNEELIQSGSYFFTYSKGITCKDLQVLTSFNNSTSTMAIMPKFTIKNAQSLFCTACVYFYYQDGRPLTALNYSNLSFCQSFTPAYPTTLFNSSYFSDLYINVPYSSINIPRGTYGIKYYVALFNNGKQFATSDWYNTSFTRN